MSAENTFREMYGTSVMRKVKLMATLLALLPALFTLLPRPGAAQEANLQLPISMDANFTSYDGKTSMLVFRGLRLSQGSLSIQADEGRASNLDFDDSKWRFSGNVIIDLENGHIESDRAEIEFSGAQLQFAAITGSPATFRMKRPGTDDVTYAEAGRLEYNFEDGIVEFSDNATITEGGNQISSDYLVYDIREQRISAKSAGDGDPKVKIIYTPQNSDTPASDDEQSSDDGEGPR